MDLGDSDEHRGEARRPRLAAELREKRVFADSPSLWALRTSAAVVALFVPLVSWPALGWAHLLFAPFWAGWGWALATILQLIFGPQHVVQVDAARRVSIDGEPVEDWQSDPRLQRTRFLEEDELSLFVHARLPPGGDGESPVIARRVALDRETWEIESLREDHGLRIIGWLWLFWSVFAMVMPLPAERAFLAPVAAGFGFLGLGFGMLLFTVIQEWVGLDRTRCVLVHTPTELRVDGRPIQLAGAQFQVVERGGFATLLATDGQVSVRVAHHRPTPIRLLASELRARAQVDEGGSVPAELEAMRGRPERDAAQ